MSLDPLSTRQLGLMTVKVGNLEVKEIDAVSLDKLLDDGIRAQKRASRLPLGDRLAVFGQLVEAWRARVLDGSLGWLVSDLARTTGYSVRLMESELKLVCDALDPEKICQNLRSSLGDPEGLARFVEVAEGEWVRHMPAGPVFIISSGNSLIPPLIPTALSLVSGNFTILRPSLSNYRGVFEVFKPILHLGTAASKTVSDLLVIGYFRHDSPSLAHLLTQSRLGVVNFWGGEPARGEVSRRVAENPNHPRLVVNGPLTGVAVIDEVSAGRSSADGLAKNIILYDQQLCSSPTTAIFIGSHTKAMEFAKLTAERLESLGGEYPMEMPEGAAYTLQSARRAIQFKGSALFSSQNPRNMWTIVVSEGRSVMDEVVSSFPEFSLHARRRFIEIISVRDEGGAIALIGSLPAMKAFKGIDKIQTVGVALAEGLEFSMAERLAEVGVFRIVTLEDMYMRSPSEPYDGLAIPSSFTYTVYRRTRRLQPGAEA